MVKITSPKPSTYIDGYDTLNLAQSEIGSTWVEADHKVYGLVIWCSWQLPHSVQLHVEAFVVAVVSVYREGGGEPARVGGPHDVGTDCTKDNMAEV